MIGFEELKVLIDFLPEINSNKNYKETEYYKKKIEKSFILNMVAGEEDPKDRIRVIDDTVKDQLDRLEKKYKEDVRLSLYEKNNGNERYQKRKRRENMESFIKEARRKLETYLSYLDHHLSERTLEQLDLFFKSLDEDVLTKLGPERLCFYRKTKNSEKILELSKPLLLSSKNAELVEILKENFQYLRTDKKDIIGSIVDNLDAEHFKKILEYLMRKKKTEFAIFIFFERMRKTPPPIEAFEHFFSLLERRSHAEMNIKLVEKICDNIENVMHRIRLLQMVLHRFPKKLGSFSQELLKDTVMNNFGEIDMQTSLKILQEFNIPTDTIIIRQILLMEKKFSTGIEELRNGMKSLEARTTKIEKLLNNQHREITENRRRIIRNSPSESSSIPHIPEVIESVVQKRNNTLPPSRKRTKTQPEKKKESSRKVKIDKSRKSSFSSPTTTTTKRKEKERKIHKKAEKEEKILYSDNEEEEVGKSLLQKKFQEELEMKEEEDEEEEEVRRSPSRSPRKNNEDQEVVDKDLDMLLSGKDINIMDDDEEEEEEEEDEGQEERKKRHRHRDQRRRRRRRSYEEEFYEEEEEFEEFEFETFQHKRIFVGRIMKLIKESDLVKYFRQFGRIQNLEIIEDEEYNSAWVEFSKPEECYDAFQITYPEITVFSDERDSRKEAEEKYVVYLDVCDETENLVPPPPEMKKLSKQMRSDEQGVSHIKTTRIRVAPIHEKVKNKDIEEVFKDCGEITNIRIVDVKSPTSKKYQQPHHRRDNSQANRSSLHREQHNYAYVEFRTKEAVIRACQRKFGAYLGGLFIKISPVMSEVNIKNEIRLKNIGMTTSKEEITKFFEDNLRQSEDDEERKVLDVEVNTMDESGHFVAVVKFTYLRHAIKALDLNTRGCSENLSRAGIFPICEGGNYVPKKNTVYVRGIQKRKAELMEYWAEFRSCGIIVNISFARGGRSRRSNRGRRGGKKKGMDDWLLIIEYLSPVDAKKCKGKYNGMIFWGSKLKVWLLDEGNEKDSEVWIVVEGLKGKRLQAKDIYSHFNQVGQVISVDYQFNNPKAWVEYRSEEDVRNYLTKTDHFIKTSRITEVFRSRDRQGGLQEGGLVRTVIVGYFRSHPSKEAVEEHFRECGKIVDIQISRMGFYATIKFSSLRGAWNAIVMKRNQHFQGKPLYVDACNNKDEIGIGRDIVVHGISGKVNIGDIKRFFEMNIGERSVWKVFRKKKNDLVVVKFENYEHVLSSLMLDSQEISLNGDRVGIYLSKQDTNNENRFDVQVKGLGHKDRSFIRRLFWNDCGDIFSINHNQDKSVTYIEFQSRDACQKCLYRDGEMIEGSTKLQIFRQRQN